LNLLSDLTGFVRFELCLQRLAQFPERKSPRRSGSEREWPAHELSAVLLVE
jgi:hypothetical protein